MIKVALLIGVSEYGSGLNPLPNAVRNVELVRQALQPLQAEGFDEVKSLLNPNPPMMRKAIESLFSDCTNDDVVLLFFSGHIVEDDSGNLYLATAITCKNLQGELMRVSAVPVSSVHDLMSNSPCQHHVVIFDCYVDRVSFQETTANTNSLVDIQSLLGGKGRTILSSFTPYQDSLRVEDVEHSRYTYYFAQGIRTGAADLDRDGWIAVDELHEYAKHKVQIAAPALNPEFYTVEDGNKILLLRIPIDDPKLKYRQEVESWINGGEISQAGRYVLDKLAESLHLSDRECAVIEAEVLKPYQTYQEKLQHYQQAFTTAISKNSPVSTQERKELKDFQHSLGLRDKDIAPVEERMALQLVHLSDSDENADELAQWNNEDEGYWMSSTLSSTSPEFVPLPSVQVINPTPALEDETHGIAQLNSNSEPNAVPSTLSAAVPESTPMPLVQPSNPTSAVHLSSSWASSPTRSGSTVLNKFLLPLGIGGALVTVVVAIGIFARLSVNPPVVPPDQVSSSPTPSATLSPKPTNSDNLPNPSPSTSPESNVCTVFVNGNLRSEPTVIEDNIIESLKTTLPVTGKQTKGGWVEVKLPNNDLGWAYPDIIENQKEMDACLTNKGISVTIIEDPPPPALNSFP